MAVRILLVTLLAVHTCNAWFFGNSGRQEALGDIDPECLQKASDGDCDFYTCFEARHPCDSHNYALNYGLRFCHRFREEYDQFNQQGQELISGTRRCSMMAMLEHYNASHVNCEDVEAEAKMSHSICERQHGICDISMLMANKERIRAIYFDNFSRRALVRLLYTINQCGTGGMNEFITWILSNANQGLAIFSSLLQQLDIDFDF